MSHLWIVVVQWALVRNVKTGKKRWIVVVQWVCLAVFHIWWSDRVRDREAELKATGRDKLGAGSVDDVVVDHVDYHFLSLLEVGSNALWPLVNLKLRETWAPTPEAVLREARGGGHAPNFVISAEYDFACSGPLELLSMVWNYCGLFLLVGLARMGFKRVLWGAVC